MKKTFRSKSMIMLAFLTLSACSTYSVTVVHSEGVATDVVDETQAQSPSTSVDATASVPSSLIP